MTDNSASDIHLDHPPQGDDLTPDEAGPTVTVEAAHAATDDSDDDENADDTATWVEESPT
jgi:hypothetical protein